ncbi:MAG: TonB-dependent receptor, partial [Pseudomonadota bacterium]
MNTLNQPRRGRNRILMGAASAFAITLGSLPISVLAQEPTQIEMPAQPLNEALGDIGNLYDITVIAPDALLRGKRAPAISGSLTAEQAITQTLAGSALTYRRSANGGFIIEQERDQAASANPTSEADTIVVTGKKYLGSIVETEAGVGFLGTLDYKETPYSVTAFSEEQIANTQSVALADLVAFDPTIRLNQPRSGSEQGFTIRGLKQFANDTGFNGLFGINNIGRASIENAARVDVIRGPATGIIGVPLSQSLAGTINIIPKRAEAQPTRQITAGYFGRSTASFQADVGQRFGTDDLFGARLNFRTTDGGVASPDSDENRIF